MAYMLSSRHKIQRGLFPDHSAKRRTFKNGGFSVAVYSGPEANADTRCTFVISKKVARKAVQRNLLKRRGYSIVRSALPRVKKGYLLVFYPTKEAVGLSFADTKRDITALLVRAGLIM